MSTQRITAHRSAPRHHAPPRITSQRPATLCNATNDFSKSEAALRDLQRMAAFEQRLRELESQLRQTRTPAEIADENRRENEAQGPHYSRSGWGQ